MELVEPSRVSGGVAVIAMGGSWYHDIYSARITNPVVAEITTRSVMIVVRLCADLK